MTKLDGRLKKLESLLTDVSGLVPHTKKWLDYWTRWFECSIRDSNSRRGEKMPLDAARAIMQAGSSGEEGLEDDD
jgi:hypothetical protein